MGPASPATFGGAPQIRRICTLAFEISAAQNWLHAANRAMCVSLGRQIAPPRGGTHMSLNADLNAAKYREQQ
jgi:hypothetical protein